MLKNHMVKAVLVPVLVAGIFAACAAQDKVTLKHVFKVGDKQNYTINVTMSPEDGSGDPVIKMVMKTEEKVTKVNDDGSGVIESRQMSMSMNYNGQDLGDSTAGAGQMVETTTITVNNIVKTLVSDAPDVDFLRRLTQSTSPVFPGKEVAVGDTWTHSFKADSEQGWRGGTATMKLLAVETVGSVKCAKISHKFEEQPLTDDAGKIVGENTFWISLDGGELIKGEGKAKGFVFPQMLGDASMQMEYAIKFEAPK